MRTFFKWFPGNKPLWSNKKCFTFTSGIHLHNFNSTEVPYMSLSFFLRKNKICSEHVLLAPYDSSLRDIHTSNSPFLIQRWGRVGRADVIRLICETYFQCLNRKPCKTRTWRPIHTCVCLVAIFSSYDHIQFRDMPSRCLKETFRRLIAFQIIDFLKTCELLHLTFAVGRIMLHGRGKGVFGVCFLGLLSR